MKWLRQLQKPTRTCLSRSAAAFASQATGYGAVSAASLLDSPDTAICIVEGIIPAGATEGSRFDVRVFADPRSGTTSLEGGRLYTTDLRPGQLQVGSQQAFALAEAAGPLFINPFAEPGAVGRDTVNRTSGRVLNGGRVMKDMPLKLQLVNPSHSRARVIQNAINARFPQERGQENTTARGESDELIAISVPPSYYGRTDEFVALMKHTTIRLANPEAVAMSVRRWLLANPAAAAAASLRWQALGRRIVPMIQDLYDYPEELPRLAAVSAGAKMGDGMVVAPLIEMSTSASFETRLQAVELLADMQTNPRIDGALRALLNDEDQEIRLAVYEALLDRGDPYLVRQAIDDKFVLDIVECEFPMIYITQFRQPRIVLFGRDLSVETPLMMNAWSNRLMINGDSGSSVIEVYFREQEALGGVIHEVQPELDDFIVFLGHQTSVDAPQPGLGLSYAETVGALHQIWRQGHINADFEAEQDRLLAAILRREGDRSEPERPEFSPPGSKWDEIMPPPEPDILEEGEIGAETQTSTE